MSSANNETIVVKAQDLHILTEKLIKNSAIADRPNRSKVCKFIINLVENGGHKTEAALAAGYGSKTDKEGNQRAEEARRNIAASTAARLLSDVKISDIYEQLLEDTLVSKYFVKILDKEHVIYNLYRTAMEALKGEEKNFSRGITALKEVAQLCGFYEQNDRQDIADLQDKLEELTEGIGLMQSIKEGRDTLNEMTGSEK